MGGLREKLYENGWMLQGGISTGVTYDLLHPDSSVPQAYTGQRPTYSQAALAVLTYDLSRVGFSKDSQFIISGEWNESSYLGSGTHRVRISNTVEQLLRLHVGNDRCFVRAGSRQ